MTVFGWITILVILIIFGALFLNLGQPDALFLGATAFLALIGIISPEEAFSGFANSGMLTVAMMFVVAAGLRETGILDYIGQRLLGKTHTEQGAIVRLSTVVIPLSGFLNNTPIVALFMPVVLDWCRRHNLSPSRLLIPLSYMSILGGTVTLIGTSTNLIVNGLMIKAGMDGMSLFEISPAGIPYALIGFVYLLVVGTRVLPDRKELLEQLGESRREYIFEMLVQPDCRLVGQTVQELGHTHLPGQYLVEIDRGGEVIGPARPDEVIQANDQLVFSGVVDSIVDFEKIPGLIPATDPAFAFSPNQHHSRRLCEAVISESSPLVGKTIREADFRAHYGAAVVAVHRGGSRVVKRVSDIRLRPGDTMLLEVNSQFVRTHRNNPSFYLVSNLLDWRPLRRDRSRVAVALFLLLIVMMAFELVPTLVAATLIALLMVFFGCVSAGEARRSVEWQVLITIGASFGVGIALENSGVASTIAQSLVEATRSLGPVAALAAIYIVSSLLTELITNNAAAVLLFPFCLETARLLGVDPTPLLMALILAASASFMTPIGYQTNLMVYGPGGYRFSDFFRVGAPLQFLLFLVATILIPLIWPF